MSRIKINLMIVTFFLMIGSGCVILGVHTAHEKQVDGVILYESASAIKGLKPHQICQISNNIGRPTARAFTTETIRNIVQETRASVVNIYVKTSTPIKAHVLAIEVPGIPGVPIPGKALGSGFICSNKGFVLTNAHVVDRAKELSAKMENDKEYNLQVIAVDQKADIALLKIIKPGNYPATRLVNSKRLSEGDWVIAIGNPLGLNHSVSHGIISQRSRELDEELVGKKANYPVFLQSDTPINPGNSGGPLFDLSGQVVGINTAIIQGAQGISFTVPTERIRKFLNDVSTQSRKNVASTRNK